MKYLHILLYLTFTCFMSSCSSRPASSTSDKEWKTGVVGPKEGLTSNRISSVVQDGDGFIWVGTYNGLFHLAGDYATRYDARQMGLSSPVIGSLYYDKTSNTLWIPSLQAGISRYDCKERTFTTMTMADGLISNMVPSVTGASDGGVWIVFHNGQVQHWKNGVLTTLQAKDLGDVVRSAIDDKRGHLYLCMRKNTVTSIDTHSGDISTNVPVRFPYDKKLMNMLTLYFDHVGKLCADYHHVRPLIDNDGNQWRVIDDLGLIVNYRKQPLFRIGQYTHPVGEHVATTAVDQDKSGNIWVGTKNELLRCSADGVIHEHVNLSELIKMDSVYVNTLFCANDNNIYLGINEKLVVCYNPANKSVTKNDFNNIHFKTYCFLETKDGTIFAGTERGLWVKSKEKDFRYFNGNLSMASIIVYSIDIDSNGYLWVATIGGGVTIFDKQLKKIAEIRTAQGLPSDNVNQVVCNDKTGEVWLATDNGIAHIFDCRHPEHLEIVDSQQGLADNNVIGLRLDGKGELWLSTPIGIALWDSKSHRFVNYNYMDGIPEGFYFMGTSALLADGRVCFGSHNGMAVITPPEKVGQDAIVGTFHLREPTPWWKSPLMIAFYACCLIYIIFLILRQKATNIRIEASQTERILQQAAPITELPTADKEFLGKITSYIENNLGSDNLDVESVASAMAMSHSVFYRRVKAITGCTAAEYLRQIRLRAAHRLLEKGEHTVQEVALLTGFKHLAGFRENFKNEFGLLPSEVQKSNKVKE